VTAFSTIDHDGPIRVVVAGAGNMGRRWMKTAAENPDVQLLGVADIFDGAADKAVELLALTGVETGTDAVALALRLGADALINVTVPAAHHPVATAAMKAGLAVIGEKPAAATVSEALSLAATAELTGRLFVVSQSRRYDANLFALRHLAGGVGRIGVANVGFFRDPNFGGFREEMDHPLLLDMAIHPFDSVRFILGEEPVSVTCDEFNPPWSPFAGDAAAAVTFTMSDGARFLYNASWCSPGLETSWNGEWRLSGEAGTVTWDGDNSPVTSVAGATDAAPVPPGQSIAGSLADFVTALRGGAAPLGEIHENIMSLAMVEAAVVASNRGDRVEIDEVLAESHDRAIADETDPEVLAILRSWSSVRDALTTLSGTRPS
jgi:predicted dehydrogenase